MATTEDPRRRAVTFSLRPEMLLAFRQLRDDCELTSEEAVHEALVDLARDVGLPRKGKVEVERRRAQTYLRDTDVKLLDRVGKFLGLNRSQVFERAFFAALNRRYDLQAARQELAER